MVEKNGLFLERYSVWDNVLAAKKKSTKRRHVNIKVDLYEIGEL
jgi:hypothetical protein